MPSNLKVHNQSNIAKRIKVYKDIDLNFTPHPITGDLNVLKDIEAIKTSLKNIILTKYGEKPFNYYFGSRVSSMLFENLDSSLTLVSLKQEIEEVLSNFEPRITFDLSTGVLLTPIEEENRLEVSIRFSLTNQQDQVVDFNFYLERVR